MTAAVAPPGRVLVTGPFSYFSWGATFGDTEALRAVEIWLTAQGVAYDVARHVSSGGTGVDIKQIDPAAYATLVYVCGPWFDLNRNHMLGKFPHCFKIGINLSILVEEHGFDVLFPRDIGSIHNPDLVFSTPGSPERPVAGAIFAPPQMEYQDKQQHDGVHAVVMDYLGSGQVEHILMDTIYHDNKTGFSTVPQFENVLRRLDVVITSRLHGLVFALKNGVPAVAIDAVAGGGKVTAQALALEWPHVLDGTQLDVKQIGAAVKACLDPAAKAQVKHSQEVARTRLDAIRQQFQGTFQ